MPALLFVARAFDFGDDVIQRQTGEHLLTFPGGVAVADGELIDEADGVHHADLPVQYLERRRCDPCLWSSLTYHRSISSINSIGEAALEVRPGISFLISAVERTLQAAVVQMDPHRLQYSSIVLHREM